MDPEAQTLLDHLSTAKTGLELARQAGLVGKVASWFRFRKSNDQFNPRARSLKALQNNAVETLASVELTVAQASQILEPEFGLDDLGKVDSTWKNHWAGGATNVGTEDHERRTWWARLLAGEIQQPGTFSLRTLSVMNTMSTKEAQLFARLCDYVWNGWKPVLILPSEKSGLWKPNFSEAAMMESSGLMQVSPLGVAWGPPDQDSEAGGTRQSWPPVRLSFNKDIYGISHSTGVAIKVRCGRLVLTDGGQELYRLTTPKYPVLYRDEIVAEWRESWIVDHVSAA